MEKKHIEVWEEDKQELMLFKLQCKAKNMPETMRIVLEKLKGELHPVQKTGDASHSRKSK